MTSINRIIVQFLLEIDTFLFEFHVEFTLHRWELKLIRRIIYNTKSDICLVVSDMKYPDRRNDMRFTQRLRIIPVSDSGATNFKYRLCRKTVHFPTVMPQSSVRRVLHLQIFHKNNKLQSFFPLWNTWQFLERESTFRNEVRTLFHAIFFNGNCRTVSHKLHVQHIPFYALQTHSVFFQPDSIFLFSKAKFLK
jgi:hypothetical protein